MGGDVDFHGHFYDGVAKRYVMAMANPPSPESGDEPKLPLQIWYETDMEGKPLRFAEIGRDLRFLSDNGLQSSDFPLLYEEFDPTSFSSDPFPEDKFDIPEVCKNPDLPGCKPGPQNRHK